MKRVSYLHTLQAITLGVLLIFLILLFWSLPQTAYIKVMGTFSYFFFNGFFAFRLYYPYQKLDALELLGISLLLSISINSLAIYLLNRVAGMPFTLPNVLLTSGGILAIIILGHLGIHKKLLI